MFLFQRCFLRGVPLHKTNLSNGDVLELRGEGEDTEELDLAEGWLQELVVGGHGLVGEVVVTGNTAEVCHLAWA